MLRCPVCKSRLHRIDNSYTCQTNHSFDIAKQGYINLLINQSSKIKGDSKEMLLSRVFVQEKKFYDPLLTKVLSMIPNSMNILDIGCGIGYYTKHFYNNNQVIGIDIAKDALKIASRNSKDVTYIVASNKDLPIENQSVDLVLNIFAPIYLEEVLRVLKDNQFLLVVSPNQNHLIELKEVIYDSLIQKDELRNDLELHIVKEENIVYKKVLDNEELKHLFHMTPHYWTSTISGKERLSEQKSLEITFDFNIKLYQIN